MDELICMALFLAVIGVSNYLMERSFNRLQASIQADDDEEREVVEQIVQAVRNN